VIEKLTLKKNKEDTHTTTCVKIVDNVASMVKSLNVAAHSSSVAIGHVKQILATAVSGDNISQAAVQKATNLGKRPLRIGSVKRKEFEKISTVELLTSNSNINCQEEDEDDDGDSSGTDTDTDTSDSSVSDSDSDIDAGEEIIVMLPDRPRNKGPKVRKKRTVPRAHNRGYSTVFAHRQRKTRRDKPGTREATSLSTNSFTTIRTGRDLIHTRMQRES
jgi:hypothetical protein